MSVHIERVSPEDRHMPRSLTGDLRGRFVVLSATYAAQLFDYAQELLRDQAAAAEVLEAALTAGAAHLEQPQPSQTPAGGGIRPWLYATVRKDCQTRQPGRSMATGPDGHDLAVPASQDADRSDAGSPWAQEAVAEALTAEFAVNELEAEERRRQAAAVTQVLSGLSATDCEILGLSFRHGLRDSDVGAVFGIAPRRARGELSGACERFADLAATVVLLHAGWSGCRKLDRIVGGSYPTSPPPGSRLCRRVAGHSNSCVACGQLVTGRGFGPELLSVLPIAALPLAVERRLRGVAQNMAAAPPSPDAAGPARGIHHRSAGHTATVLAEPGASAAVLPEPAGPVTTAGKGTTAGPSITAAAAGKATTAATDTTTGPVSTGSGTVGGSRTGVGSPNRGHARTGPARTGPARTGPARTGSAHTASNGASPAQAASPAAGPAHTASNGTGATRASSPGTDSVGPGLADSGPGSGSPASPSHPELATDDAAPGSHGWLTRPRAAVASALAVIVIVAGVLIAGKLVSGSAGDPDRSASVTSTHGPSSQPSGTAPSTPGRHGHPRVPLVRAGQDKSTLPPLGQVSYPSGQPGSSAPSSPNPGASLPKPKPSSPKPKPSSPKPKPSSPTPTPSSPTPTPTTPTPTPPPPGP